LIQPDNLISQNSVIISYLSSFSWILPVS